VKSANVTIERRDSAPVAHVRGEVDLPNSEAVRAEMLATLPIDGPGMIVDLTQTTYLDSSGVRVLFELAERLEADGQRLALVVTEEALIRRVIVLTKLDDVVLLAPTVDEALAALRN
jgi:anti-anti-sigma factor